MPKTRTPSASASMLRPIMQARLRNNRLFQQQPDFGTRRPSVPPHTILSAAQRTGTRKLYNKDAEPYARFEEILQMLQEDRANRKVR